MSEHISAGRSTCRFHLTAALLPVMLLAACGGSSSDAPDPLDAYRQQTLNWQACDAASLAELAAVVSKEVMESAQCAQMRAPLDYGNPTAGELSVGMLRVKALADAPNPGGSRAVQSMFFNPGGPGGDGYVLPLVYASQWADIVNGAGTGSEATRQRFKQLLQTYDLIGFSPRGTGRSTTLECASDQLLKPVDHSLAGRTPANIRAELHNIEATAQACAAQKLMPYIHTDATARDMDLMREVLGGEKLHYYGASYGTWLGLWYASVFPEKAGRMVLDSNMDFTADFSQAAINTVWSQHRSFNEAIAPYAASRPDLFGLGGDVQAIRDLPLQLPPAIRSATARQMASLMNRSENGPYVAFALRAGQQLSDAPFAPLWPVGVSGGDFAALDRLIDTHSFHVDELINLEMRWSAHRIVERVTADLQTPSVKLSAKDSVYKSVVCNDTPSASADPAWWSNRFTELYQTYPLADLAEFETCLYWQRPAGVVKPALASMKSVDVLLVQSQYDVPTPHENARAVLEQLPAAHMVYVSNEMSHGVFPYRDECVDASVVAYLLGTSPKERMVSCTGRTIAETRDAVQKKSGAMFTRPVNIRPDGILW